MSLSELNKDLIFDCRTYTVACKEGKFRVIYFQSNYIGFLINWLAVFPVIFNFVSNRVIPVLIL